MAVVLPKNHREHVFEPFFTTKEQGKGTGLGLSMVFGAIKTHGGFVELESTKAKGATFHLYFPLIAQEKTVESLPQEEKNHVPQNDKLILIADDEPMVRDTVAKVLASMHYTVLTACDGLEALTIFKKHHDTIHLVVLDVVMPHLGGMALATKIRAINAHVPVIFLTGYDRDHVLDGNAPLVNSDLLSKPVNFGVFNSCMRRLIDAEALIA